MGPTGVGKTAVAVEQALQYGCSIISADSRQCYRELNIGVARPAPKELATVPHYFIATHSIHEPMNAGIFEQYALGVATNLFQQNPTLVVAGGTGLYLKSFLEGMDDMPEIDPRIRQTILEQYEKNGLPWLQDAVKQQDPLFWAGAEQQNPHRLMRALEMVQGTGKSITEFRKRSKVERPFRILKIGIELPRALLYERIDARVDQMIEDGLLDEVRNLHDFQHLNALQTVGYQELFSYLNNDITFSEAVAAIKRNTRHYAKRQLTWFKKDPEIQWYQPDQVNITL